MEDVVDAKDLGRALCIITGASRGFGRAAAVQLSERLRPRSALLLAARSSEDLRMLHADLAASKAGKAGLVVECVVADLSVKEGVDSVVKTLLKLRSSEEFDHLILVNNAGKQLQREAMDLHSPHVCDNCNRPITSYVYI